MIGKLTGRWAGTMIDGNSIIDVQGVGYAVRTTQALATRLAGLGDEPASLFIHTVVREDALDLYGFAGEDDLSFFIMLTRVSGVGPKTAINIMNLADTPTLKRTVARADTLALTRVIGVGKKSAERIVLELKDKFSAGDAGRAIPEGDYDVVEALLSLGYSATDARQAAVSVSQSAGEGTSLSSRITRALQLLGNR